MLTKQEVVQREQAELDKYNKSLGPITKIVIKNVIDYPFGWYVKFDVVGEPLCGGPAFGHLYHKIGYKYEVHYVGTPWDTGIGDHMTAGSSVYNRNGHLVPSPHVLNFFHRHVYCQELMKSRKIPERSFKTDNGYDLESACKWLKLDLCIPHRDGWNWIGEDSGKDTNYMNPDYDKKFYSEIQKQWFELENKNLYPQNFEAYYKTIPGE